MFSTLISSRLRKSPQRASITLQASGASSGISWLSALFQSATIVFKRTFDLKLKLVAFHELLERVVRGFLQILHPIVFYLVMACFTHKLQATSLYVGLICEPVYLGRFGAILGTLVRPAVYHRETFPLAVVY